MAGEVEAERLIAEEESAAVRAPGPGARPAAYTSTVLKFVVIGLSIGAFFARARAALGMQD